MTKKLIITALLTAALIITAPVGFYYWLERSIPQVTITEIKPEMPTAKRIVPFFEVMVPLPEETTARVLPELEYRKGPPERYLHRIAMRLLAPNATRSQEAIYFYGRQTRTDAVFSKSLSLGSYTGDAAEARFIRDAIAFSQNHHEAPLLLRFAYLLEAKRHLQGVAKVWIMEQAGSPAFLFSKGENEYTALFSRKSSFYTVEFHGENSFQLIDPIKVFQRSFITERRSDALDFVARNLSAVSVEKRAVEDMSLSKAEWPLSLLAAFLSLEPSSLDGYFHFAGLSALLYKSPASDQSSQEVLDVLRNNVLVSEFYAKDINPEAGKTKEISQLARSLLKSFQ
jgi:hypothetical protein